MTEDQENELASRIGSTVTLLVIIALLLWSAFKGTP